VWRRSGNSSFIPDFDDSANATAMFCETSYYSQKVRATIQLPENSILQTSPSGPKEALPRDVFNSTQFEYILGAGVGPHTYIEAGSQTNAKVRQDIPDGTLIHQDTELSNMSLLLPTSNMVGFAIGLSRRAPSDYLDPENLELAFKAAHKLLFAVAANSLMTPTENETVPSTGVRVRKSEAVVMIRTFTILVEVFMAIIVVLTTYLACHYSTRRTNLNRDPSSILELMKLSTEQDVIDLLAPYDKIESKELERLICDHKFQLNRQDTISSCSVPAIRSIEASHSSSQPDNFLALNPGFGHSSDELLMACTSTNHVEPRRPSELSWGFGIVFIAVLCTAIAAITTIRIEIAARNGRCQSTLYKVLDVFFSQHVQAFRSLQKIRYSNSSF
jgi:hypothetical protein